MKLTITSGTRTVENAWGLVGNVVWSGDKRRAARTLSFDLATSQADPNLPAVECPVGAIVSLWGDDVAGAGRQRRGGASDSSRPGYVPGQ